MIDAGIYTVCTHYCLHCYSDPQYFGHETPYIRSEDCSFLCLNCSIMHKKQNPEHYLQSLFNAQELALILKREG